MGRRRNWIESFFGKLLLNVSATLFIVGVAVIITINFRPLYYADISLLKIPDTSGYSKEVIKENYDALISYNSPFYNGKLEFPAFKMSEMGRIHFVEVKRIFNYVYLISLISGIIFVWLVVAKIMDGKYGFFRTIAITSSLLPVIVCSAIAINFDNAFVLFHKIFFNNDYWVFDPITDPVINILPSAFFLHCAIMIIILIFAFNLIMYRLYRGFKDEHDDQYIIR